MHSFTVEEWPINIFRLLVAISLTSRSVVRSWSVIGGTSWFAQEPDFGKQRYVIILQVVYLDNRVN